MDVVFVAGFGLEVSDRDRNSEVGGIGEEPYGFGTTPGLRLIGHAVIEVEWVFGGSGLAD